MIVAPVDALVQHPTAIVCDIPAGSGDAGRVKFLKYNDGHTEPIYVIHLRGDVCAVLRGPVAFPDDAVAEAVRVVTHEALHLRNNDLNETRVECQATLNVWQILQSFHLAAKRVRGILAAVPRMDASLPDIYHREACA